jgi:hemoglobin-like flavoprotein
MKRPAARDRKRPRPIPGPLPPGGAWATLPAPKGRVMTQPPHSPGTNPKDAALIEASLERFVETCPDPVAAVYERLFARHPEMAPYFWRDTNGDIKGEMLSRTVAAILDFIGERHYADHMIGAEMVTHEGYDVPRETFATFFAVVRDAVRGEPGAGWSPACEAAWGAMLGEMDAFADATPRSDVVSAYHAPRVATFQRGERLD